MSVTMLLAQHVAPAARACLCECMRAGRHAGIWEAACTGGKGPLSRHGVGQAAGGSRRVLVAHQQPAGQGCAKRSTS